MNKRLASTLIVFVAVLAMFTSCSKLKVKDDKVATVLGGIVSRRLGVACAEKYLELGARIVPIAEAILKSSDNRDDLITILQLGLIETPGLDPVTRRDIMDLLSLLEVEGVPKIYFEVALAFLEGFTM